MTVFCLTYAVPPRPKEDNQYWQELERRLGVTWDVILTPLETFGERSATLIAGGEIPDFFYINPAQGATAQIQSVQQGAFLDITDYVTGDAINAYPNLATFEPYMWDNIRVDGRIYGVPKPTARFGDVPYYRSDWAQTLGISLPTNADEMFAVAQAFRDGDPDGDGEQDTWGLGKTYSQWDVSGFTQMYRVPHGWRVNDDGTFTSSFETEEHRRSLEFRVRHFEQGIYHPDSPAMTYTQAQDLFYAGTTGLHSGSFGSLYSNSPTGVRGSVALGSPGGTVGPLMPPGWDGGDCVTHNRPGSFGFSALPSRHQGNDERIQELLRILDYLAAPFGSEERIFLGSGIEGVHHTIAEDGTITTNDTWDVEEGGLAYIMNGLDALYFSTPEDTIAAQEFAVQIMERGIDNPTWQLYSPASAREGAVLAQLVTDTVTAVVTGREPLDAFDEMLNDWRSRGGDQIRQEYEEARAALQG